MAEGEITRKSKRLSSITVAGQDEDGEVVFGRVLHFVGHTHSCHSLQLAFVHWFATPSVDNDSGLYFTALSQPPAMVPSFLEVTKIEPLVTALDGDVLWVLNFHR